MKRFTRVALCSLLALLLLGASALAGTQTLSLQDIKDEAMQLVQDSTALQNELLRKGRDTSVKAAFAEGNDAYNEARYEDAIDAYTRYLTMYPRDWQAYNNRALCAMQLGYFRDALSDTMVAYWIGDVVRPEALLNLLVAGHGLGFDAAVLLHAMRVDTAVDVATPLTEIYTDAEARNAIVEALAFNIAYAQMESPGLSDGGTGSSSPFDLLTGAPMADDIQAVLETLDRDEDVAQLMDYLEALLAAR
ncbi:hypothetical protein LJC74_09775 [Eubacteriales bacterium OttesenSCG-928-A19]|nr:hypothetical protein [Eubacteriales bacterium OttesenSCG-928-A19]